jgi:hypothetical protein
MIIDSNPIAAEERLRSAANPPAATTSSRRGVDSTAPVPTSGYSRVMDEVSRAESGAQAAPAKPANSTKPVSLWEHEDFGFADFLDIINPLQHIPIISTIYRNLTGDQIGMAPRVIGGALWGRIGGFVTGVINSVVEWFTGKDIGDHIYAAIFGTPSEPNVANAVAQAQDVKPALPDNSQVEIPPEAESLSSTKVEANFVPTAVPLTSTDSPVDKSQVHSSIGPTDLICSQVLQSFYHYDNDRNATGAKQPRIRVSA